MVGSLSFEGLAKQFETAAGDKLPLAIQILLAINRQIFSPKFVTNLSKQRKLIQAVGHKILWAPATIDVELGYVDSALRIIKEIKAIAEPKW